MGRKKPEQRCWHCAPEDWTPAHCYAQCRKCRRHAMLYEAPRTTQGELLAADALFNTKPWADGAPRGVGKGGPISKRRKV